MPYCNGFEGSGISFIAVLTWFQVVLVILTTGQRFDFFMVIYLKIFMMQANRYALLGYLSTGVNLDIILALCVGPHISIFQVAFSST